MYKRTVDEFERSLIFMHKMPVIWIEYFDFLRSQGFVTETRRAFDRALQSLPITQHHRIWPLYTDFVKNVNIPALSIRIMHRRLMIDKSFIEDFLDHMLSIKRFDEAVKLLISILNDPTFSSKRGRSSHDFWVELCNLVSTKSRFLPPDIDTEAILRSGIFRFTEEVARLWCALAAHFTSSGRMSRARDVYDEALVSVCTVKDFTTVFDAYVAFLEACVTSSVEENASKSGADFSSSTLLWMSRLEALLNSRAELLSAVKLRQNPNSIVEWVERSRLFIEKNDFSQASRTFQEAVATVDPDAAVGHIRVLWIAFATFAERYGDVFQAREVYNRALSADVANRMRSAEEVAAIFCSWIEMELRHKQFATALETARRAVSPAPKVDSARASTLKKAARSVRLWSLLLDLEECLGTETTLTSAYETALSLGVASPQMVLNRATMLWEKQEFENAFRCYERSLEVFAWPHRGVILMTYLTKFVQRYKGKKVERVRDLFAEATRGATREWNFRLNILLGKFEEEYGSASKAVHAYEMACRAVGKREGETLKAFLFLIAKVAAMFGPARTREAFALALEYVPDCDVKKICLQFAALETSLKEFERARAIFAHCSQLCQPNQHKDFWQRWRLFEMEHGDEETYKDMLRAKRAVEARHALVRFNTSEIGSSTISAVKAAESLEEQMATAGALLEATEREEEVLRGGEARGDYEGLHPHEVDDRLKDQDVF
eukprot:GDKJ01018324.1.p1 GENE.GDKJ01018324.1~~GDKJ01018324.1.p1  ORF type:complete len:767 (-),score=125.33 GDKJ01018324.1:35-2200(-)